MIRLGCFVGILGFRLGSENCSFILSRIKDLGNLVPGEKELIPLRLVPRSSLVRGKLIAFQLEFHLLFRYL